MERDEPSAVVDDTGGSSWKGELMNAQQSRTEHHVVGPVHVLALHDDDADSIATALERERDHCSAARVIIDITGFDGSMNVVLDAAEMSGWDHDIMVRTADQRHLTLDDLRAENRTAAS